MSQAGQMDVDASLTSLKDFDPEDEDIVEADVPVAPPSPTPADTPDEDDEDDDDDDDDDDVDDSSPDKGKDDVFEEEIGKALHMVPLLRNERNHGRLLANSNKKRRREEDPEYSDDKLDSMNRPGLRKKGKVLKTLKSLIAKEFDDNRDVMDECRVAMDNLTEAPAYAFAASKLKPAFDLFVKSFVDDRSMNLITLNVNKKDITFPELVARMLTATAALLRAPARLSDVEQQLNNVVGMMEKKDDEEEELLVRRARVRAAKARSALLANSQDNDTLDFE